MAVAEQWALVEADFLSVFGVDLEAVRDVMRWRRFEVLLRGLLTDPTSRVARFFAPKETR